MAIQPDILQRRGAGQKFKITQAHYNGTVEAAQFARQKRALATRQTSDIEPWATAVDIKNDHTSSVRRGDVLAIEQALIDADDKSILNAGPTFRGTEPQFDASVNNWGRAAVMYNSIGTSRIDTGHVAGVMAAYVLINDLNHDHCDIANGSTIMSSHFSGSWRLIFVPSGAAATETHLCLIQYRGSWQRVLKATTDSQISPGGSGTVSIELEGSPSTSNETAFFNWLDDNAPPIEGSQEVFIKWFWDERIWVIVGRSGIGEPAIAGQGTTDFPESAPFVGDAEITWDVQRVSGDMETVVTTRWKVKTDGIYHMSCTATVCGNHDPRPEEGTTANGRSHLSLRINGGDADNPAITTHVDVIEYPTDRGRTDTNVSYTKKLFVDDEIGFFFLTPEKNIPSPMDGNNGIIFAHCEITFEGTGTF